LNGFGLNFQKKNNPLFRNLACKTTTSPPTRLYKLIAAEQEKNPEYYHEFSLGINIFWAEQFGEILYHLYK